MIGRGHVGGNLPLFWLQLRRCRLCSRVETWGRQLSGLRGSVAFCEYVGRSIVGKEKLGKLQEEHCEDGCRESNLKHSGLLHRTAKVHETAPLLWVNPSCWEGEWYSTGGRCSEELVLGAGSSERLAGMLESGAWNDLCEEGHLHEAFLVLDKLSRHGTFIARATLYRILKECIAKKDLVVGRLVHALSIREGYELNPFLGNHIIRMYASNGSLLEAKEVFSRLPAPNAFVWAAIISAHREHGRAMEAIDLYRQMRHSAAEPHSFVFVAVLKACASAGDIRAGRLVHRDVVDSGSELNLHVGGALVDMYCKCGSLVDASSVFERLPTRDVVTWSALIAGYSQHGLGKEALMLFERMHKEKLPANDVTYTSILKACGSIGAVQEGRRIHAEIQKRKVEADVYVSNALLHMYCKCGSFADARRVFDRLLVKDVVTWNAMIAGCAQHGLDQEALELYSQMQEGGLMPDTVTFVSVLKCCANLYDIKQGKVVHARISDSRLESDAFVGSALVGMYAKCGSLEEARSVFDRLQTRNLVTWNAMIGGYAQQELGELALKLFESMQGEGVVPDTFTLVSVLKACGSSAAIVQGRQIHSQIVNGKWNADEMVGNALVSMYAKCGTMEEAQQAFSRLSAKSIVTWNALINGYAQHNDYKMVVQCFDSIQRYGIQPDAATYTSLLVACSHVGLVEEGEKYFRMMSDKHGINPSVEHHNCMVDLLGRAGRLVEAESLLQSMPFGPQSVGLKSLLTACKLHRNVEIGRRCFDQLVKIEPQVSAGYILMSNIYQDAGLIDDYRNIEFLRKAAGAQKKAAMATIEVQNKVYEFVVGVQRDDTSGKLQSLNPRAAGDDGTVTQSAARSSQIQEDKKMQDALCGHAEKLALAFGLLNTPQNATLVVTKNLRMCSDCHRGTKVMCRIERREIIVADEHRVHHFKDGVCSCGDYG